MDRHVSFRAFCALVGTVVVFVGLSVVPRSLDAAPEDKPTPSPIIAFGHPVVFTMALGNPATNGAIAVLLAKRLHENGQHNLGPVRSNAWIVPQGQWTLGDYLEQCKQNPVDTLGAFIVLPPANTSSTDNWIALLRTKTDAELSVIVAECHPSSTMPSPAPSSTPGQASVVWASYTSTGKYGRSQVEFFPLAVLTTVYLAFSPQRTYQTTTTTVYPTTAPIPPGGQRSAVQIQQASVLNPSGTAGLQGNVLNAFAGNGLGATIGGQTTAESQAIHAADDAVGHLLNEQLNHVCPTQAAGTQSMSPPSIPPGASPAPSPTAIPTPHAEFCNW